MAPRVEVITPPATAMVLVVPRWLSCMVIATVLFIAAVCAGALNVCMRVHVQQVEHARVVDKMEILLQILTDIKAAQNDSLASFEELVYALPDEVLLSRDEL